MRSRKLGKTTQEPVTSTEKDCSGPWPEGGQALLTLRVASYVSVAWDDLVPPALL